MTAARIILDRPRTFIPGYCWRDEWICEFESAYSLFSKFAFLNGLTGRDLALLFLEVSKRKKLERQGGYETSLLMAECFDVLAMSSLLRISVEQAEEALGKSIHSKLSCESKRALRFCSSCLRKGFHSAIFQHPDMFECPVHREKILDRCPRCRTEIPYDLCHATFKRPYCCPRCEFDLSTDLHKTNFRFATLSLVEIVDFKSAYRHLLLRDSLISTSKDPLAIQFPGLFSEPTLSQKEKFVQFKNAIVARLGDNFSQPIPLAFESIVEFCHTPDHRSSQKRITEVKHRPSPDPAWSGAWYVWDKKLWEIYPIYQTVRRHIWRHVLHRHRQCVHCIASHIWWRSVEEVTPSLCAIACAFIQWRMHWEGCGTPRDLISGSMHAPYGILTWLSREAPECPETWSDESKCWLLHRVFAMECKESFIALTYETTKQQTAGASLRWRRHDVSIPHARLWAVGGKIDEAGPIRLFVSAISSDFHASDYQDVQKSHLATVKSQLRAVVR